MNEMEDKHAKHIKQDGHYMMVQYMNINEFSM